MPKNLLSNQKGLTPVVIAVIVAAVLVIGGGGYFFLSKSGNAPSITAGIPAVGLNPNCKHNDPDLCKFLNNWKEQKQYSVKSQTTKGDSKSEATFEISGEDKFHMMMSENGKEGYNVITIGDTTYTKDYTDNKWWKHKQAKPEELTEQFNFDFDEEEGEAVEDKTTYKKIGKEACGDRQCFKYEVVNPDMTDFKEFIYFDDREYLVRKMRVEGKDGEVTESEFTYSGVNISEPSPTKEAEGGQVIVPGGGAMPAMSEEDKAQLEQMKQEMENSGYSIPESFDTSGSEE